MGHWVRSLLIGWNSLIVLLGPCVYAQVPDSPGSALPALVQGNELFGRKLLAEMHREQPEKNVVVAPISLALMLAAIQVNARSDKTSQELGKLFGWGQYPRDVSIASRMLLGAFQKPDGKTIEAPERHAKRGKNPPGTESEWISNAILYKPDRNGRSPFSTEFRLNGADYFGIDFRTVGDLGAMRKGARLPDDTKVNVVFDSKMHVQMVWRGNMFLESEQFQGDFRTAGGVTKRVEMQSSELNSYPYVRTDLYEAVMLSCYNGTMTVVLPTEGKSIEELEVALTADPAAFDRGFSKRFGSVTMPSMHLQQEQDLVSPLKALGVRVIFEDMGRIATVQSYVGSVSQKLDLQINRDGIRGDADTVIGIGVFGVLVGPEPFQLRLDRPFLFLIRDQASGALTYIGVVMDPSEP